jgi:hypothetical protein
MVEVRQHLVLGHKRIEAGLVETGALALKTACNLRQLVEMCSKDSCSKNLKIQDHEHIHE